MQLSLFLEVRKLLKLLGVAYLEDRLKSRSYTVEEVNNLQCALIVSQGCPQLIVHTDRLKWPVAKQWEQTFVKGIVSSLL